ncbi:succinate dehydrogenase cytochrome b560 subunit [Hysterangium stoloniferum]|nr:succinate dehydrogenase cytochrome b560 subunit [Hysterangium stoloniferum]
MMSARGLGLSPALRQSTLVSRRGMWTALSFPSKCSLISQRGVQTESLPPSASQEILNAQRLHRPSSPHFTIYQPQLTWLGSIANRITGSALSVLLYGFSLSYLVLPAFGLSFDGAQLVDIVHSLPEWVKLTGKTFLAAPFAFHSWNGVRHLLWDSGKFLTVKGAYITGYAVLGATAVTTVGLVCI